MLQHLVERSLLAFLEAVAGVLLAQWAGGVLVRAMPGMLTGSGALAGIVPALRARRTDPVAAMRFD